MFKKNVENFMKFVLSKYANSEVYLLNINYFTTTFNPIFFYRKNTRKIYFNTKLSTQQFRTNWNKLYFVNYQSKKINKSMWIRRKEQYHFLIVVKSNNHLYYEKDLIFFMYQIPFLAVHRTWKGFLFRKSLAHQVLLFCLLWGKLCND